MNYSAIDLPIYEFVVVYFVPLIENSQSILQFMLIFYLGFLLFNCIKLSLIQNVDINWKCRFSVTYKIISVKQFFSSMQQQNSITIK